MRIKEVIVVEGRDDTAAVKKAVDAITIETHGYGISKATWKALDSAEKECGLIIFTDPDGPGRRIRQALMERYPNAKQAFLKREKAEKRGDIGIENASPEAIREALAKAKVTEKKAEDIFSMDDLARCGLAGGEKSKELRDALGDILGIGYGNAKTFLKKLNMLGVTREDFEKAIKELTR